MANEGVGPSSQKRKGKKTQSVEEDPNLEKKNRNDVIEEKGFLWKEVLDGKDVVIAAKDALISELYKIIQLLEDKINHLSVKENQNSNRTFCEVTKVSNKSTANCVDSKEEIPEAKVNHDGNNYILIKPTRKQENKVTKREIIKYVKTKDLQVGIQKVFNLKDGGIKIQCKSKEDVEHLKKEVVEKMSEHYETKTGNKKNPRIKIIGMEQDYTNEELVEVIKNQNDTISDDSKLEVIVVKKMRTKYMAIVEVDSKVFKSVMESGMLLVDLTVCTVFEHVDLLRCFRCTGYHHTSKNCKNKNTFCIKCGLGEHLAQDCETGVDKFCCPNCVEVNERHQLNFPINHGPFSRECEVFKKKADNERRKIEYK